MALMLGDHLWATLIPGNMWLTYFGRLAFPIFAYQIAEGSKYQGKEIYLKRLFIFALISEIPFNLLYMSSPIFPFHQNVIWTLLLGYMGICSINTYTADRNTKSLLICILKTAGCILLGMLLMVDYSWQGVTTVIGFFLLNKIEKKSLRYPLQVLMLVLLNQVFFNGNYIPVELFGTVFELHTQCLCVFSLLLIWAYNGKKGINIGKYTGYIFYPLHMVLIYIASVIF